MRDTLTTVLEVVGAGVVAFGVGWFSVGAGVIVAGVALIAVGYLGGRQ